MKLFRWFLNFTDALNSSPTKQCLENYDWEVFFSKIMLAWSDNVHELVLWSVLVVALVYWTSLLYVCIRMTDQSTSRFRLRVVSLNSHFNRVLGNANILTAKCRLCVGFKRLMSQWLQVDLRRFEVYKAQPCGWYGLS